MTRNVNLLKTIEDASIPDEWMSAELIHENVLYCVRGEMFICPYTDRSVECFKANPQYNGLVAQFLLTYTIGSSEEVHSVSFYYNPLEEGFLDTATFEDLQDRMTKEVFLAMDGKKRGTMKSRRVLHEAKPLCYVSKMTDVVQNPILCVFAKMFLKRVGF